MGYHQAYMKPGWKRSFLLAAAGASLFFLVSNARAMESDSTVSLPVEASTTLWQSLRDSLSLDSVRFSGTMTYQYQGRFHGEDRDNELYRSYYLEMEGLADGKISGALGLRLFSNLDNYSQYRRNSTYYVYEGISDSYSRRNFTRLYYGYLDFTGLLGPGRLRVGRQILYPIDYLQMDGASYLLEDWKNQLDMELFAGVPVEYYSSRDGDYTYGFTLDWKAMDWLNFRGAGMAYSDSSHHNTLYAVGSRQHWGDELQLMEDLNLIESSGRNLQLQGIYTNAAKGLTFNATYYRQLKTLGDYADPYSPYYQALSDYEPFHLLNLNVVKEAGDHWVIEGGCTLRELTDSQTESAYNHAYQMYWGGVTLRDVTVKNLSFSLFLQRWVTDSYTTFTTANQNANPDDSSNTQPDEVKYYFTVPGDRNDTLSAELQYRWGQKRRNKIQLGTDYQKYKYHYETDEEYSNVRTWYLKCNYWINDKWQVSSRLQMEKQGGDPEEYYRIVSAVSHRF